MTTFFEELSTDEEIRPPRGPFGARQRPAFADELRADLDASAAEARNLADRERTALAESEARRAANRPDPPPAWDSFGVPGTDVTRDLDALNKQIAERDEESERRRWGGLTETQRQAERINQRVARGELTPEEGRQRIEESQIPRGAIQRGRAALGMVFHAPVAAVQAAAPYVVDALSEGLPSESATAQSKAKIVGGVRKGAEVAERVAALPIEVTHAYTDLAKTGEGGLRDDLLDVAGDVLGGLATHAVVGGVRDIGRGKASPQPLGPNRAPAYEARAAARQAGGAAELEPLRAREAAAAAEVVRAQQAGGAPRLDNARAALEKAQALRAETEARVAGRQQEAAGEIARQQAGVREAAERPPSALTIEDREIAARGEVPRVGQGKVVIEPRPEIAPEDLAAIKAAQPKVRNFTDADVANAARPLEIRHTVERVAAEQGQGTPRPPGMAGAEVGRRTVPERPGVSGAEEWTRGPDETAIADAHAARLEQAKLQAEIARADLARQEGVRPIPQMTVEQAKAVARGEALPPTPDPAVQTEPPMPPGLAQAVRRVSEQRKHDAGVREMKAPETPTGDPPPLEPPAPEAQPVAKAAEADRAPAQTMFGGSFEALEGDLQRAISERDYVWIDEIARHGYAEGMLDEAGAAAVRDLAVESFGELASKPVRAKTGKEVVARLRDHFQKARDPGVPTSGDLQSAFDTPQPKDPQRGAVPASSLVGGVAGAGVGALVGGPVGAAVGGVVGAALGPAAHPVIRWMREKAGDLGFIDNTLLEKFRLKTGVNAAERYARMRQALAGATDTATEAVNRALVNGAVPADATYSVAAELPTLVDMRRRALAGQAQNINGVLVTVRGLDARIARARAALGNAKADQILRAYADEVKAIYDEQVAMGQLPPGLPPEEYVHHVVSKWHEGKGSGGGGKPRVQIPGSAKKARGSLDAGHEMDAFRALGEYAREVYQSKARRQFVDDIRELAKNDDIRATGAPMDGVGLYSWGEKGSVAGEVIQPAAAKALIEEALSHEFVDPATGIRKRRHWFLKDEVGPRGGTKTVKKWATEVVGPDDPLMVQTGADNAGRPVWKSFDAFDSDLAGGLGKAAEVFDPPGLVKAMNAVNTYVKGLYVSGMVVPNVQYQFNQLLQDFLSGGSNVPAEHAAFYARRAAKYAVQIEREMAKIRKGGRSPFIENLREKGALGGGFLDMFEETGRIKADILPFKYQMAERSAAGKAAGYAGKGLRVALDLAQEVNRIRETAIRLAMRDVYHLKMGLSAEAGVARAHRYMGNYWRPSPLARYAAPATQFTKWFTEAALRLTVRMAEDPATGTASARGFWSGPMPKVLIGKTLLLMANRLLGSKEKREDAKRAGAEPAGPLFSRAANEIFLGKDKDGRRVTVALDGYSEMLDALIEPFALAAKQGVGTAASEAARGAASRVGVVRLPLELYTGKKLKSNTPITSAVAEAMGTEEQAKLNKRNKGIPLSDKWLYVLEQVGGSNVRLAEKLLGRARTPVEVGRTLGAPLSTFSQGEKATQEKYRDDDANYDRMINEARKGSKANAALYRDMWAWAARYGLTDVWKQRMSKGMRQGAIRETLTPEQQRALKHAKVPAAME